MKRTRVDSREFDRLKDITDPIIEQGEKDHTEYILNSKSPDAGSSESFVRKTLEDILNAIKEWFKSEYNFTDKDLSNFPELDKLIYHKDGWTLNSSIFGHYAAYNKYRNKVNLINSINHIIELESRRLRNTVFDTLNERTGLFEYVKITGEPDCDKDTGICRSHYGIFKVGIDEYELPPFHWRCYCWAIYSDNPNM